MAEKYLPFLHLSKLLPVNAGEWGWYSVIGYNMLPVTDDRLQMPLGGKQDWTSSYPSKDQDEPVLTFW